MAPYNSGNHYDPVGSQYNQQHQRGYYTAAPQYSEPATTSAGYQAASYATATYQPDQTSYYNWNQHANTAQPQQAAVDNRAAEALSSLSAQDQANSSSSRATIGQYGTYDNNNYSSTLNPPRPASAREQSNTSPAYQPAQPARTNISNYRPPSSYVYPPPSTATQQQPAATQQSQSPATSYQYPARSQTAQQTRQQTQSPFQSQAHPAQFPPSQPSGRKDRTSFSTSNNTGVAQSSTPDLPVANVGQPRAPSMTPREVQQQGSSHYSHQRQESSAPTTVDPQQVYDAWPEQQRRIREAKARRKAEEAARAKAQKEEDDRKAAIAKAQKEEDDRKAAAEAKARAEEAARKAEEERKAAEEAQRRQAEAAEEAKKRQLEAAEEAKRRQHEAAQNAQRRRTEEAKEAQRKQAESARSQAAAPPSQAALDFASQAGAPPGSDLEAEMLAMFKKMREFNEKNPAMLARLWDEERRAHIAKTQTPVASPAQMNKALAPSSNRPPPSKPTTSAAPGPSARPAASATPNSSVRPPSSGSPALPGRPASATPRSMTSKPAAGQPANPTASASTAPAAASASPAAPAAAPAAAPTPQVPLVSQPGNHAIWPPGKKAHLAEAAAKWLNAKPQNAAKQISKEKLIALLDTNPSYLTLCEVLENMGLVVDRGPFARALLSAVPGANRDREAARPPVASRPFVFSRPKAPAVPMSHAARMAEAALNKAKTGRGDLSLLRNAIPRSEDNDAGYVPPPDDEYHAPPAPITASASGNYVSPYPPQPRPRAAGQNVIRPTQPQAPRRPPANKEEAARKRTFAELIDLTAMDNSDEEESTAKAPKLTTADVAHGRSIFNALAGSGSFDQYRYTGASSNPAVTSNDAGLTAAPLNQIQAAQSKSEAPGVTNLEFELRDKIVVQGIRRSNAARRSSYDPRTICRDVLLATGRHPEARALNQHLFGMHDFLKKHSTNIEGDKFDLGTLRWDLIDPGEPMAELLKKEKEPDAGAEADDEDDLAGPVIETKASTPDPAHRRKPYLIRKRPAKSSMPDTSRMETDGETPAKQAPSSASVKRAPPSASKSTGTRTVTPQFTAASFTPVNKPSSHRAVSNKSSGKTPSSNRPSSDMSRAPSSGPIGYSAFKAQNVKYDADGNPIKARGRPVGWRRDLHSKEAIAAAAAGRPLHSSSSAKKSATAAAGSSSGTKRAAAPVNYDEVARRRGRPSQPKPQPKQSGGPELAFNTYKCEWADCDAKLHNVDTLRKHVLRIHGKKTENGNFECFWEECFEDRSGEFDMPFFFDTLEDWLEHVESTHLQPLANKLGDGPRHGLSESSEVSDAYMSDATGRTITPRISEIPSIKVGTKEWKALMARNAAAKRVVKLKGKALYNEELMQQLDEQKKILRPLLDRAGSTLLNDARRRGVFEDEDFEEVESDDGIYR